MDDERKLVPHGQVKRIEGVSELAGGRAGGRAGERASE